MPYTDLFQRYGRPSDDANIQINGYFRRPQDLRQSEIARADKSAEILIASAQSLIDNLNDYRNALASRYAELETMPVQPVLELHRKKSYSSNKVFYYLRLYRLYADGTQADEFRETYEGTQRRDAINRYNDIKKSRPGIQCDYDIAKAAWEK